MIRVLWDEVEECVNDEDEEADRRLVYLDGKGDR